MCSMALFFIHTLTDLILRGILRQCLFIDAVIQNRECRDWENSLSMFNYYNQSVGLFLQALVFLLIMKTVSDFSNSIVNDE